MKISTLDLAKIALWPYVVGFTVSMLFYSRYHIFGLGLLSPHYIIIGIYVVFLYCVLPWALLSIAARAKSAARPLIFIPIVLLLIDAAVVWFICYSEISSLWLLTLSTVLLFAIQLWAFLGENFYFDIRNSWPVGKVALLLLASSVHFAVFFFGAVPYHMGGGRPAEVFVVPDLANPLLLDSQFAKKGMQVSTKRPSYAMLLLFETESEFFFLRPQFATFTISRKVQREQVNDNVVRVRKAAVDRIDYTAPRWITVSWR